MPLTDPERKSLRLRCPRVVPGFARQTLAESFAAVASWCDTNGVEPDHYGAGGVVEAFEAKVATLLGKPACVFMPSGVMAQLAAVRIWTERAGVDRFGLHPTSHLVLHEEQAYASLLALHAVPVGDRLRPLIAADLAGLRQRLACLIVELPIREAGGRLPTWDELDALKREAAHRALPLHMDGARLWECAAYYQRDVAAIADGFASVYVSLYKGIGAFAGALLAGDDAFVAEAKLWRRRMGGTLYRLAALVAPAAMRFDERLAMMPALYRRTCAFAAALQRSTSIRVLPEVPQTNLVHLHFDAPADRLLEARDTLAERDGTWLLDHAQPSEVPGWSRAELYVGDQLLTLDDAALMPLFAELMALATR